PMAISAGPITRRRSAARPTGSRTPTMRAAPHTASPQIKTHRRPRRRTARSHLTSTRVATRSRMPPATREEICEMLGEVDESIVMRVLDTGASVDEIGEALDALQRWPAPPVLSTRAAERVRTILDELATERGAA